MKFCIPWLAAMSCICWIHLDPCTICTRTGIDRDWIICPTFSFAAIWNCKNETEIRYLLIRLLRDGCRCALVLCVHSNAVQVSYRLLSFRYVIIVQSNKHSLLLLLREESSSQSRPPHAAIFMFFCKNQNMLSHRPISGPPRNISEV
jgi:hypothetical protein